MNRLAFTAMPRRRYDIHYEASTGRYVVEVVDEQGKRRQVESYADWTTADSMRTHANERLAEIGDLLPERR